MALHRDGLPGIMRGLSAFRDLRDDFQSGNKRRIRHAVPLGSDDPSS